MNHSELKQNYNDLRSRAYTRAIDALLAYQTMSDHPCCEEECIHIEVNGLQIIIQHVEWNA
jgi:hypothetical protein